MVLYYQRLFTLTISFSLGLFVGYFNTNYFQFTSAMTSLNTLSNNDRRKEIKNSSVFSYPKLSYFAAQRNLVITAAVGYDVIVIYRFARSLRASCNYCKLVMIVDNVTIYKDDFQELVNIYSILYISKSEYFPKYLQRNEFEAPNIHSTRWFIIRNYLLTLQAEGEVYDNVFMCDSQDGLFQTDIFKNMTSYTPGLYVFIESNQMTIGRCSINSNWIKSCYGDVEHKKLFNYPIICSGTVLGTWFAVLSYLSMMEYHIMSTPSACKNMIGSDQGIHNYIIHNKRLVNVAIHHISHEYGFLGTLGYAPIVKRNQFGFVRNENGTVYAFIHQWNRSNQLKKQYQQEYHLIPANMQDKKNK